MPVPITLIMTPIPNTDCWNVYCPEMKYEGPCRTRKIGSLVTSLVEELEELDAANAGESVASPLTLTRPPKITIRKKDESHEQPRPKQTPQTYCPRCRSAARFIENCETGDETESKEAWTCDECGRLFFLLTFSA